MQDIFKGEAADYWPGSSPGSRACACAQAATCSQVNARLPYLCLGCLTVPYPVLD